MTALSPMAHRAISAAQETGVARSIKEVIELAEQGAKIAETSIDYWNSDYSVQSEWRCIDLADKRRKGDYAGFLLGEDETKNWPDGSTAAFDFLFCRIFERPSLVGGGLDILLRHVVVCDVPGLGLDAKLDTDGRFCEFTEAAMLLAAWLREREGGAG